MIPCNKRRRRPVIGRPRLDASADIGPGILRAATECFTQTGYEGCNVDDIARRAGVSKKTIYAHFESKENLLREVIRAWGQARGEEMAQLSLPAGDLRARLIFCAEAISRVALSPESISFERMLPHLTDRLPELVIQRTETLRSVVAYLIAVLRQEPELQDRDEEQLRQDAAVFFNMTIIPQVYAASVSLPLSHDLGTATHERAVDVFLGGIFAERRPEGDSGG